MSEHVQRVSHAHIPSQRRRGRSRITVAAMAGVLAAGGLAGCETGDAAEAEAEIGVMENEIALRKAMRETVRAGFPGVLVSVKGRDGRTRDYTAGTGDREAGSAPPENGHVRIGSNTKTFVAATVLQLVAEGSVKLDEPIAAYLPGVVEGPDYSGKKITVRNLLGHTSGLPDYTAFVDAGTDTVPSRTYTAEELLSPALRHDAAFPVGERRQYSNTNYIVAGMLIEKVTRKPVGEAVTERVIERLGLKQTYWPEPGDTHVEKPRMEGYVAPPGGELTNATEMDPSVSGAAGMVISTPRDLNRFFAALIGGTLVPAAQLKEMQKTVESPDEEPNTVFGLGLDKITLSCGTLWGHGGDIHGYETRGGVTDDGREVTVAVNALPGAIVSEQDSLEAMTRDAMEKIEKVTHVVDTAICA